MMGDARWAATGGGAASPSRLFDEEGAGGVEGPRLELRAGAGEEDQRLAVGDVGCSELLLLDDSILKANAHRARWQVAREVACPAPTPAPSRRRCRQPSHARVREVPARSRRELRGTLAQIFTRGSRGPPTSMLALVGQAGRRGEGRTHVVVRGLEDERAVPLLIRRVGDDVRVATQHPHTQTSSVRPRHPGEPLSSTTGASQMHSRPMWCWARRSPAVAEVVRTARHVQDEVPVDPTRAPVEQVLQDVHAQVLGPVPPAAAAAACRGRLVDLRT